LGGGDDLGECVGITVEEGEVGVLAAMRGGGRILVCLAEDKLVQGSDNWGAHGTVGVVGVIEVLVLVRIVGGFGKSKSS
jgi:hypothetical protein